ncbi:MAG TPA: carbohydrate porin, partial [Gemmata sp.]|nr:carbohydrate porin [Gemmata sp.]
SSSASESPANVPGTPDQEGDTGAQEERSPSDPYSGDLLNRLRMTGDWRGGRSALVDRGLTFDLFNTQFYQGIASGGHQREFEYGGKVDYLFRMDGGKLGLWRGLFTDLHAETRYGTDVNNIDGLFAPSNLPMFFPEAGVSITSITGLKFTQEIGESFAVFLGKINTLDEYGFRYAPALGASRPGLAGFMNTSLVFNPIVARTLPYSAAGVGFAYLRDQEPLLALSVFDPEERATKGLQDLFARGVVLVPDLTFNIKPRGLPGKYNFGGTWSSASYRSFDPAAYLSLPPQLIRDDRFSPKETGSWSLYANFYQSLWAEEEDEARHWGVFGQFGISDGNPNPVRFIANGGIGGRSLFPRRKFDTFGIGYFYFGLSDNFKSLASPFLPQRDEYGVEVFYNLAITPWARLTADLQVARPSTIGLNTAIIPGLRFQLLF